MTIRLARLPICLRDVLADRAKTSCHAWSIIKAMLQALTRLEAKELVVRNIQPSTVFFSEDFSQVQFVDIRTLSKHDENQELSNHTEFPYSSEGLKDLKFICKAALERD